MNSAFVKFEIPVPGYFYQYAMLNLRRGPNPCNLCSANFQQSETCKLKVNDLHV